MALILLILIGASAGWMASIFAREEAAGAVLRHMGIGLVASLLAGILTNSGTILGGLSVLALGASVAAAIVALFAYRAFIKRTADA